MKKRVLTLLMAMSLVFSAVQSSNSITVSAQVEKTVEALSEGTSAQSDSESDSDAANEGGENNSDSAQSGSESNSDSVQSDSESNSNSAQSGDESNLDSAQPDSESNSGSAQSDSESNSGSSQSETENNSDSAQSDSEDNSESKNSDRADNSDSADSETSQENADQAENPSVDQAAEDGSKTPVDSESLTPETRDARSFIIETTESDGMFYNLDNRGRLTVWGDNIRSLSFLWSSYWSQIYTVEISGKITDGNSLFKNFYRVKGIYFKDVDTSSVTDMSYMFYRCEDLEVLDWSGFNTSNATDMSSMFACCESLEVLDLSFFDTSKVADMEGMFTCCEKLKEAGIENFDTSNVSDMNSMFSHSGFKTLNLSHFNTANVTNMYTMFWGCKNLESLDISGFDTSKVTDFSSMFEDCSKLKSLNLSSFDTYRAVSFRDFLTDTKSLTEIYTPKRMNIAKSIPLPSDSGYSFTIDNNNDGYPDSNKSVKEINYKIVSCHLIRYIDLSPSASDSDHMEAEGVLIHENTSQGTGTVNISIRKDEFENASTQYNHEIAKFACGLSTMAYSETESSITKCFLDLGYVSDEIKYAKDQNGLTATYWIANVPISADTVLVTVVVRGTDGKEWIDNFEAGRGTIHEGFERGATTVLLGLDSYLNSIDFEGKKVKLLVTGHSRGAAVANLIGHKLDNQIKGFHGIETANTFVYTFATPNVSREQFDKRIYGYDNVYNIVNPEDFVTKVLPSAWGYGRYGKNYVLPSSSNTASSAYKSYLGQLKIEWVGFFDSGTHDMYQPYPLGMEQVSDYIDKVTSEVWTINQYYDKRINPVVYPAKLTLHDLYNNTLGRFKAGEEKLGKACFFDALIGVYGGLGISTGQYFLLNEGIGLTVSNCYIDKFFEYAHEPETYMAAMNVISEDELFRNKKIMKGIINCPVDIVITNADGEVVGKIEDNTITQSSEEVSLNVEGDSKSFILPADANYNVSLVGNDSGTMDYSVCEYDCDTLSGTRIYYNDVPLTKGKTYEMTFQGNTELEAHTLTEESGEVVNKQVITEADSGKLSVSVTVVGSGSASAMGNLTPGDYVTLTATPGENSVFEGWYDENGTLLSTDPNYGFSIEKDESLTAKFKEKEKAPSEEENKPEDTQNNKPEDTKKEEPAKDNARVNTEESKTVAIGTEITSDGKVYSVTGENTVTIIKVEDKKIKSLAIPSEVSYEGKTFTVNKIGAKAFKGLKKLKSVTIPSTVVDIGSKAFYSCASLKKITLNANSSLSVGKSAFKKVNKSCKIKIKGLKKKDKKAITDMVKKQTNASVK